MRGGRFTRNTCLLVGRLCSLVLGSVAGQGLKTHAVFQTENPPLRPPFCRGEQPGSGRHRLGPAGAAPSPRAGLTCSNFRLPVGARGVPSFPSACGQPVLGLPYVVMFGPLPMHFSCRCVERGSRLTTLPGCLKGVQPILVWWENRLNECI